MQELSPEGQRVMAGVAQRHGLGMDAVLTLLRALVAGQGTMAQFSHPELGGMGQWSQGGMVMVGDMFNNALKARVDAVCTELSSLLRGQSSLFAPPPTQSQSQSGGSGFSLFVQGAGMSAGSWWPAELGQPASAGAQNDLRYAVFPSMRRVAVQRNGRVTVYDTGDHMISGVSQQQGPDQSLTFTSQYGLVPLREASVENAAGQRSAPEAVPPESAPPPPPPAASPSGDVLSTLERLAELHRKGVLTEEEFAAKKAELLSRL